VYALLINFLVSIFFTLKKYNKIFIENCGSFYISMWSCLENDRLLLNAKWIVFQLYMIVHWNTPRVEIWYLRFYYHTQHIILFLNQPVFTATPEYCVLSREAANTIFVVLGLTRWPSIHLRCIASLDLLDRLLFIKMVLIGLTWPYFGMAQCCVMSVFC
jgi:hypothetical protein